MLNEMRTNLVYDQITVLYSSLQKGVLKMERVVCR